MRETSETQNLVDKSAVRKFPKCISIQKGQSAEEIPTIQMSEVAEIAARADPLPHGSSYTRRSRSGRFHEAQ
jgi:hypothetical protein